MAWMPGARRPFTGAWIETGRLLESAACFDVAPSQGRGLKHSVLTCCFIYDSVAPSQGRGLKPVTSFAVSRLKESPLHRGVD